MTIPMLIIGVIVAALIIIPVSVKTEPKRFPTFAFMGAAVLVAVVLALTVGIDTER